MTHWIKYWCCLQPTISFFGNWRHNEFLLLSSQINWQTEPTYCNICSLFLMKEDIHRLFVVDEQGNLTGVIALYDVIQILLNMIVWCTQSYLISFCTQPHHSWLCLLFWCGCMVCWVVAFVTCFVAQSFFLHQTEEGVKKKRDNTEEGRGGNREDKWRWGEWTSDQRRADESQQNKTFLSSNDRLLSQK